MSYLIAFIQNCGCLLHIKETRHTHWLKYRLLVNITVETDQLKGQVMVNSKVVETNPYNEWGAI